MFKCIMLTLPNILTLLRLALLPPMVALFFMPWPWAAWTCLVLYALGAATDGLDGWIARRFNKITELGIMLDPIADKIFVVTVMLMLVAAGRIEGIWVLLVVAIVAREFAVSGLREFMGPRNIQVPVTQLAKGKTALQMIALGLLIVAPLIPGGAVSGLLLLAAAAVLTIWTGWAYLKAGLDHVRKMP